MLLLIRGFAIFSQLANIADDHIMRREALGLPSPLARLGIDAASPAARRFLNQAVVTPVITAHPTEVRRKSTLDRGNRRRRPARRHRGGRPLDAGRDRDRTPSARSASSGRPGCCAPSGSPVADEIDNAVSIFQLTFLRRSRR